MNLCSVLLLLVSFSSASISSIQNSNGLYTCYSCIATGCDNPYNKTCNGFSCFTSIQLVEGRLLFHKGCTVHPFVGLGHCLLRSNNKTEKTNCCEGNFCNNGEFPSIPDHWTSPPETNEQQDAKEVVSTYKLVILLVLSCIFVPVIVIASIKVSHKRLNLLRNHNKPSNSSRDTSLPSSDSGSGGLNLNQRCMAQDIDLIKCIGQGRFGEVHQGMFHGENVAVKIFPTTEEASWQNEVNIYTKIALYNENVLGFKGSVITTRNGIPELWLLTAYHKQGSLYDYLSLNAITLEEMKEYIRSICSGLFHLHAELVGEKGKPAIAHRDLKTRNILLTCQGTCVIADLGHAVVNDEILSTKSPINYQVGTKRYMAPEILDNSIKINSFESFKRTDVYAFGLILWEVCSRCLVYGTTEAYRLAFHDCVPSNPDFEDMKKVVCIESKRPEIPDSWSRNKTLNAMAILMKECWHGNPEIRSSIFRVKKILDKMNEEMQELPSTAQPI